jgi:hypothetical protein
MWGRSKAASVQACQAGADQPKHRIDIRLNSVRRKPKIYRHPETTILDDAPSAFGGAQHPSFMSAISPVMTPKPLIYAELLSNIRQISVIVALPKPCGPDIKVELSTSGREFILLQGRESTVLNLPGQVASNVQLQKPAIGSQELSSTS